MLHIAHLPRAIRLICLLILALTFAACGSTTQTGTQTGQQTPIVVIQTAPPTIVPTIQPTAQPTATPTEIATPTPLAQVQIARSVNLRTGPGLDYAVIRTLKVRTIIDLIARRDENGERWYQVRAGADEGWVSGVIVQVDESQAAALPINSEAFTPPTATAAAKPKSAPPAAPKPTAVPEPTAVAVSSGVRIGAICRDGTRSNATGRGACSHHVGLIIGCIGSVHNSYRLRLRLLHAKATGPQHTSVKKYGNLPAQRLMIKETGWFARKGMLIESP
jgi:SH3-like domain-containing protein